ncbi:hypothetical protein L499_A2845 [Bordetella holmesii CDC-H635-BH]|nr:hypothetical protein L499_A2845 [Bordetella holmesii CDC-H635-BH]
MASMLPEFTPPSMALTFSLSTSSLVFWMALGGAPTSSRATMTTFLPSTPPAALISSAAWRAPASAEMPKSAEPVADISLLKPILMSSASALALASKAAVRTRALNGLLCFTALSPGLTPYVGSLNDRNCLRVRTA